MKEFQQKHPQAASDPLFKKIFNVVKQEGKQKLERIKTIVSKARLIIDDEW